MHRMLRSALLFALLLVPLGQAATATVSATATITGSGSSYRVTIRNTGDEPLRCVGLLLDGVQPTAATGPAGVLTRVGTFQGRGLVHMLAQASDVVAPGGSVTVPFTTNVPIATNAGGELRYSSTCAAGSDVIGRATGPAPPAPPPNPSPAKCKCESLAWVPDRVSDAGYATMRGPQRPSSFELRVAGFWTLECTRGSGGCRGSIEVAVPPALQKSLALRLGKGPRAEWANAKGTVGTIICRSGCGKRRKSGFAFNVLGGSKLGFGARGVTTRSITLYVFTNCSGKRTRKEITAVFDNDGLIDFARSDFNGNDIPDGREG